jgi:DNA-binding response OmpR family regulator
MTRPENTPPPDEVTGAVRVLYVEDDQKLAQLTRRYLESHGLIVTWVGDGEAAMTAVAREHFDVALLDIMLPRMDGVTLCRQLRTRTDLPIIMLTARDEEADKVLGLESGADDYLAKPYSTRELLARIRAQVRRARGNAGPPVARTIQVGALVLEPGAMAAFLDGKRLSLTAYEFSLLRALAERRGSVRSLHRRAHLPPAAEAGGRPAPPPAAADGAGRGLPAGHRVLTAVNRWWRHPCPAGPSPRRRPGCRGPRRRA